MAVVDWTIGDVGDWLKREGYGAAVPAFASCGVDGSRLLTLNDASLKVCARPCFFFGVEIFSS